MLSNVLFLHFEWSQKTVPITFIYYSHLEKIYAV